MSEQLKYRLIVQLGELYPPILTSPEWPQIYPDTKSAHNKKELGYNNLTP